METTALERAIPLVGCGNFRDLGGYVTGNGRIVRWRQLFRSDSIHQLTDEDVAVVRSLGVRVGFDLRSEREVREHGVEQLREAEVRHVHAPFVPVGGEGDGGGPPQFSNDPAEVIYLKMLDRAQSTVRRVFLALAEETHYPAVIFCTAGKDRTGLMSALLLRALGVADEAIIADYALSKTLAGPRLDALRAQWPDFPESMLGAAPATLSATLAALDARYGSTQGYLADCGVTLRDIEHLRRYLLLEPAQR